jgi:ABC-type transport system involved in multi-copper enzyme maturation permease subunit
MSAEQRTYPALGRSVWTVLLRTEWFKARHRLAFLVTLGLFTFVTLADDGGSYSRARRSADVTYALPEAWSSVFSEDSVLLLIFATLAVIMLVSSEFTWRTARQNVIDGLSKTQWFWGKVILVLLVGIAFVVIKLTIGAGAAALGTDFATLSSPAFPLSAATAAFALFLAYLSVASLGLLCSVAIRNSGPAIAVWFFWITLGEQLLPALVARALPVLQPLFTYLPFSAAQRVMPFWVFDGAAYGRMVEAATAAGDQAPELPNLMLWLGVNVGWTLVFVATAFTVFRRRDL